MPSIIIDYQYSDQLWDGIGNGTRWHEREKKNINKTYWTTNWNIMKHYDRWEMSLETHPISMKRYNTEWSNEFTTKNGKKKKKETSIERDTIDIDY